MPRNVLLEFRRDTAANWTATNPVLAAGEPGWETNTNKLKIGDGVTAWNALAYFAGAATGTISDLTSSGGTLTITAPTGPTTNVDLPASGVTAATYGDSGDVAQFTVDAEGRITAAANVAIAGGGTVVAADGWVPDTTETWTYASFAAGPPASGTFTIAGDLRTKYAVGTRIRLVQTTTKYFVVTAAPTFDGVNTTVTISGGTDYTLANAAISSNYHSYVVKPQGWPTWFTFTPSPTGFTGAVTVTLAKFAIAGNVCQVEMIFNGTSNATTMTCTAPVKAVSGSVAACVVTDNGGAGATPGRQITSAGSTTISFSNAGNWQSAGGFTNSGAKGVVLSMLTYEI